MSARIEIHQRKRNIIQHTHIKVINLNKSIHSITIHPTRFGSVITEKEES